MSITPKRRNYLICPRCAKQFCRDTPSPAGYFILSALCAIICLRETVAPDGDKLVGLSLGVMAAAFALAMAWNIAKTRFGRSNPCPRCNFRATVDQRSWNGENLRRQSREGAWR